jgi:hypothetical protein
MTVSLMTTQRAAGTQRPVAAFGAMQALPALLMFVAASVMLCLVVVIGAAGAADRTHRDAAPLPGPIPQPAFEAAVQS